MKVDHSSGTETSDLLAPVVASLRLRGLILAQVDLSPPWGLSSEGFDDVAFYFIARGTAFFEHRRRSTAVSPNELLVVAPRRRHLLRDHPKSPVVPFRSLEAKARKTDGYVRLGKLPPTTSLLSGCFCFDGPMRSLLLSCLPPVIHLRAQTAGPAVHHLIHALAAEVSDRNMGGAAISLRLAEALFIHALRACIRGEASARGWLGALGDPQISRALTAFHTAPEAAWTVEALAARASLSRSSFAAKFTELVGESPLAYVKQHRMSLAASLLSDSSLALKEIADRVGYRSDESFNRAFRQVIGDSPGHYRARAAREASLTLP